MAAARDGGATIVPIDSEHNAIFQCLSTAQARIDGQCLPDAAAHAGLARIVLTASGGPFRGPTRAPLAEVTVEQAVAHPNWSMGPKIPVDSATLMNHGLDAIQAHPMFGLPGARIDLPVQHHTPD